MKRSEFNFDLPENLIAQQPLERRSDSRLLQLSRENGSVKHRIFRDLPVLLRPNDLLVLNDTRVIPARLFGRKESGGRVEILVERIVGDNECLVQIKASKSPRPGTEVILEDSSRLIVLGREMSFYRLLSPGCSVKQLIDRLGHVPLPPYIDRADHSVDQARYQTVFADRPGAVAAPTAGLHFDQSLLDEIDRAGINRTTITLHVGAGTFQPVRTDDIRDHVMHPEYVEVGLGACEAIENTKKTGGRIIAVGTTAVRSLETASSDGNIMPYTGESRLFIYPGYRFLIVDGIITNFHLPESTLLMLMCAFAGKQAILNAYKLAIEERYRFYSYGDAMLIV
jgi:S-adenosylmethionine:tRNA ribosyltransferase-isomerase